MFRLVVNYLLELALVSIPSRQLYVWYEDGHLGKHVECSEARSNPT
ncbi:hypothetical protein GAGA_3506 [Paraglaciecola agarilytica NO2]|uniref:Uncharacterized protein n=1 Tax=Paraglaciecola agarilytica NO2 TaxID=1125747 RepID=A0ABQ0IAL2_9ALTE|nr:hypothetical protein GAGA_3506 [Paraglaciecola agarilytica NO2]